MTKTIPTGYEPMTSIEAITSGLESVGYISTQQISTAVFLALGLRKPILIEGPAGVGKTDLAASLSRWLDVPLLRLQCYEGLDEGKALYEWKYGKQLLYTQLLRDKLGGMLADTDSLEASMERLGDLGEAFYSDTFLEPRPLLHALRSDEPAVLLIDEIDKADQEFEAFLLELLSDFQISIPELGTVKAKHQPLVLLTSNDQRELSDALKRRCLHLYIPYPAAELEAQIVATRVPDLDARLREQLVAFIQHLREQDMKKLPAISETLDWARALVLLHADSLEHAQVADTLNLVLKTEQDVTLARELLPAWLRKLGKR